MTLIDDMKKKIEDKKQEISEWRTEMNQAANQVKAAEGYFKEAKRRKNRAYMGWVAARKELKREKARLSSLPSRSRKYTLTHLGKVLP